jgi:nucleotide-binding universal stress UspA family protein
MKVEFKQILCATDLSTFSNTAVYYGAALARIFEAKVHLCHVIDLPMVSVHGEAFSYPPDYLESLQDNGYQQLKTLMEPLSVAWEAHVETGAVARTIAGLSEAVGADLVIAATHGRSGLKRLLLGSVTEQLIRIARCPFLIVPPPEKRMSSQEIDRFAVKRVLVGCDFSKDSARAVEYGFSLAQEFQAALHLVHVIEPFAYKDALMPDPLTAKVQIDLDAHLKNKLDILVPKEARNWCDVTTDCLAGRPFEELIKYAVLHTVDLIILGIRGHGLVESFLLGSTTDRVIRRATCPVLTVGGVP